MSLKPSSPSTNIPDTDPFDSVAYTDIVDGSIDYEKEVGKLMNTKSTLSFLTFLKFNRWKWPLLQITIEDLFPLMLLHKDISVFSIDTHRKRTFNFIIN